jgi:hypothetical protein
MEKSESYLILEHLIQKRLLVIRRVEFINWLNNLERTGQISDRESKDLLTLAEKLEIYDLPIADYPFLFLLTYLYPYPSMLPTLDYN